MPPTSIASRPAACVGWPGLSIAAGRGAEARESLRAVRAIDGQIQPRDAILWGLSAVPAWAPARRLRSARRRLPGPPAAGF